MVETTASLETERARAASSGSYLNAYRWMLLARLSEEKYANLYRAGKIFGGVFVSRGQEALSASIGVLLRPGVDVFAPLIRDQAARLAFGESLLDATRTVLGSKLGPMRGREGNVHRGRPRDGYYAMISHLGAMIPAVAGALLARRFKGATGCIGVTCIGDGGTSTGAFHEGLNLAAVEHLPLVVVVANNQYAYSTPNSREFVCASLVDKAAGYGVEGHAVDGTDLGDCLRVVGLAFDRARAGHGPQLVVASLLRLSGHGEHDDAGYVDPKLKASPLGRDCLKVAEEFILANRLADASTLASWRDDALRQIEEAVATAQREPAPDPGEEEWRALFTEHLAEGYAES
jgi:pyruvate dehydrogenase E1 component alpha subunit/2-oxoisovalerate dehydrogenase E1 component alpha subunit